MAVYTMEIATDYNFPNLTVYRKYRDGVHYAWRVTPNDGYVMYDTNANDVEYDENGNEYSVIYYYTSLDRPLNANWSNFSWVAVLRSSVDENYIFGLPDNDHEVM